MRCSNVIGLAATLSLQSRRAVPKPKIADRDFIEEIIGFARIFHIHISDSFIFIYFNGSGTEREALA